jgi:PAS domain S-box-containing protein
MDEKTIPLMQVPARQGRATAKSNKDWENSLSYQALFEQTSECIFIISLDFHYITANQQALDLLGYEEYELINKPIGEVVSQEETPATENVDNQQSHLQERIFKRKDGTTVPVEISTTIVYDDNDEPAYIQSVVRDISSRKKTEQTLKRNTLILSIISEATARLLQSTDIETKLPSLLQSLGQAFNISYCAIFTVDTFTKIQDVQIRYSWSDGNFLDADCLTRIRSNIPQLLESGSHLYSTVQVNGQNQTLDLALVSIPVDGSHFSRGFLCFLDRAENLFLSQSDKEALKTAANLVNAALQRKYYEERIRLSEIRNRIIVDSLPDLIIRVDISGKILDYSANPNHPLYIHRDLVYGRNINQTFPEEIVSRILGKENQEAFVSPNRLNAFRLPYAIATYESSLQPICSDEALIIIRDVTEEVRLNQMKSDFINRASHELRTPLTSAMLIVELIQEGGTPREMEECWNTLKSELHRQKDLIDSLLMAGRLESGMMKIEAKVIDLLPILRESMRAVQPIIAKRNISLVITNEQLANKIWGDNGGLQQVFINLINNAAKFSPEGNTVTINITHTNTHIKVAIVDKGFGIPPEDIPHLFEQFYRARNVSIAEIPGSGIGLYIVHSIVKELGGEITVDSILDKGTTFTVSLRWAESQH